MKRWWIFVFLLCSLFIFQLVSAITGETITGDVSSQPTNVSIFVLPGEPVIQILSPENATYYSSSILVNYTIGNPIISVWYNLDDSGNISLPLSSSMGKPLPKGPRMPMVAPSFSL